MHKLTITLILFSFSILPLQGMDKGYQSQRLYPLLNVAQSKQQTPHESTLLLTKDLINKDAATMHMLPTYQDLYISSQESEAELNRLTVLLAQKEKELSTLSNKLPGKLRGLTLQRAQENIKSNATVGGVAFGFYLISMIVQLSGDPRLSQNGGENWSIAPFCNNLFGWVGSQMYAGSQCCCRKPENEK